MRTPTPAKSLRTVPCSPTTIGITVIFFFHSFFLDSCKVQVFDYLSCFFYFLSVVNQNGKIHVLISFFSFLSFLVTNTRSGFLTEIKRSAIIIIIIIIGQVGRVFANDPGDLGSIPGRVIPKTLKMALVTSLLNTQQYKVGIEGKMEQSRESSSTLPNTSV